MTCLHRNIFWEDFFKPEKQNNNKYRFTNARCLDCGVSKGRSFAFNCQLWYLRKIGEWSTEKLGYNCVYGTDSKSLGEFINKNYPSFESHWQNLKNGKIDQENFEGLLGQLLFWEASRSVEKICQEFKKEKENPNSPERERERERESKNEWIKPVLIGGGALLGVGLVIYLISKQSKRKSNY